jgi:integrase
MELKHISNDGTIRVAQEKTNERVWVPTSLELKKALDAWFAAQDRKMAALTSRANPVPADMRRMILTGEKGRRLSADWFRHVMINGFECVEGLEAGLAEGGVTTHRLRTTAATILAELGCDWETIASITGHDTADMARLYTHRKRRAKRAIAKLDAYRNDPDED